MGGKNLKVIVCENEGTLSLNVLEMIKKAVDINSFAVENPASLITVCLKEKPDLVITNIASKKDMSGLRAVEIVLKELDTPAIFLTIDDAKDNVVLSYDKKIYTFISKPFNRNSFYSALNDIIFMKQGGNVNNNLIFR